MTLPLLSLVLALGLVSQNPTFGSNEVAGFSEQIAVDTADEIIADVLNEFVDKVIEGDNGLDLTPKQRSGMTSAFVGLGAKLTGKLIKHIIKKKKNRKTKANSRGLNVYSLFESRPSRLSSLQLR